MPRDAGLVVPPTLDKSLNLGLSPLSLQIFSMFDEDGSGELDKEEFVSALGCAGFEEEEAISMFDQVDNVGQGMPTMRPDSSTLSLPLTRWMLMARAGSVSKSLRLGECPAED